MILEHAKYESVRIGLKCFFLFSWGLVGGRGEGRAKDDFEMHSLISQKVLLVLVLDRHAKEHRLVRRSESALGWDFQTIYGDLVSMI